MARETPRDRRERVAAMQAAQKAAERRRLFIVMGACVAVIAIIAGAIAFAVIGENNKHTEALGKLSGDTGAASCDPVIEDPATGSSDHFGPGTAQASVTHHDYATIPPTSGPHLSSPVLSDRRVYTVADAPPVEGLVHNLEHGYTILWYDPSLEKTQADTFAALAKEINAMPESANKFIITPWDTSRGALPDGKKYALTHWGATVDPSTRAIGEQKGYRQLCGGLTTGVVQAFVKAHPWSSAPEPGAA